MRETRKLIVVDFDNTLFFTNRTSFLASKELFNIGLTHADIRKLPEDVRRSIYHLAATKYGEHSRPNKELHERLAGSRNANVMILTARHNSSDEHTMRLLKKHGVRIKRLRSRNSSEMGIDDGEWKGKVVSRIAGRYGEVDVYEDKLANIKRMMKAIHSKKAKVAFYLVRPRTIRRIDADAPPF